MKTPVTMAAIKADKRLADMALVKYSRLSVQPVTAEEWKIVCKMGGIVERPRPRGEPFSVVPAWSEGPDLRSAIAQRGFSDSGFDASHRPGMTTHVYAAAAVTTCASNCSRLDCER